MQAKDIARKLDTKQQIVRLRFKNKIAIINFTEFYRIRLYPGQLKDGEKDFYQPKAIQPHRVKLGKCSRCRTPMKRVATWEKSCPNPSCDLFGRIDSTRPARGVVRVDVPSDFVTVIDGIQTSDTVFLVLDRRYSEKTLRAVYQTAGAISEENHWAML